MEAVNRKILTRTQTHRTQPLPIKVLQFGEGNFLRAFADWIIDLLNEKAGYEAGIAVVQPIEQGLADMLNNQDGLYHHLLRGLRQGQVVNETRLISCIQEAINPFSETERFFYLAEGEALQLVISNTTEAGIQFDQEDIPVNGNLARTFPGKLTQFLYRRFQFFDGDPEKGLSIIPCELIEKNGEKLKEAIRRYNALWELEDGFEEWIEKYNSFANTLVDRIVPGYPKDEIEQITEQIGMEDKLVVSSETFHLWVIEGDERIRKAFPADKHGLNVKYVEDLTPYRTRKVRILNGAHTSMVPVGLLAGIETVRETVEDEVVGDFVRKTIFEEIVPTIALPKAELNQFAEEVIERFRNPFIRHELITISLNSVSKYKVRVLPTVLDNLRQGVTPHRLLFALACLIKLYMSEAFSLKDNAEYLDFFSDLRKSGKSPDEIVDSVLGNEAFWEQDLNRIDGLNPQVKTYFAALQHKSVVEVLKEL